MIDLITMDAAQILVLDRMDPELGFPFRDIAEDCGLDVQTVRGIIRSFHEHGLTGFGPLFDDDTAVVRGSGYWLNRSGYALQQQLYAFHTLQELWAMRDAVKAVKQ